MAAGRQYSRNIGLILLSLFFLPLDSLVVGIISLYNLLRSRRLHQAHINHGSSFVPRRILVTGVSMSKGLVLARAFHQAGHTVIGADFDGLACGRMSKSLTAFFTLQKPNVSQGSQHYVQGLLDIITSNNIDLWVSCSGVASAVEDGEAKEKVESQTSCRAIQFDIKTTQVLHEKHTFIERSREIGLIVPETHTITRPEQALAVLLDQKTDKRYIMKPIGMDDANRGDMTLLPKKTPQETQRHISKLRISSKSSWILQQYIRGPEYCTHAVVIDGKVRVFVACPSAELLMHYEALPSESKLSRAMLEFTEKFAAYHGKGLTGHLSFDFMVEDTDTSESPTLYPIECNPRAHTAVVLFTGTAEMIDAYLEALPTNRANGHSPASKPTSTAIVIPNRADKYFWIGHDLAEFFFTPLRSFTSSNLEGSVLRILKGFELLAKHLLMWKDGTFELWDPMPWWMLYHVYWPSQFLKALVNDKKWSRVNVSTTKIFECGP